MQQHPYDVAIVGGGAAGSSAALVLGRARRRVVVIDAENPRDARAARVHGYLSRDGMSQAEFRAKGQAEVARYGVEVIRDRVERIDPEFVVHLHYRDALRARRVLISTGVGNELPEIPGVRERWGRDLLHCPYSHGWEVRDTALGVLGTIAGSVQHALLVRQWSDDVVFFTHECPLSPEERAQLCARSIRVECGVVTRLVVQDDRLMGVELADGRVVVRTAVFIRPGNHPDGGGLLEGLGCAFDDVGFPIVDATGRTTIPGVWAAGNAVDPRALAITAAGAGSAAAIAINADLVQDDVARGQGTRQFVGAAGLDPAASCMNAAFRGEAAIVSSATRERS